MGKVPSQMGHAITPIPKAGVHSHGELQCLHIHSIKQHPAAVATDGEQHYSLP